MFKISKTEKNINNSSNGLETKNSTELNTNVSLNTSPMNEQFLNKKKFVVKIQTLCKKKYSKSF